MNYTALFILVIIVLAILGLFVIPHLMLRRALKKVVKTFRAYNATNIRGAKTLEELGLNPPSFIDRMFRMRDYRPYAVEVLRRNEIVLTTEDGRLYLLEDKLRERFGNMGF